MSAAPGGNSWLGSRQNVGSSCGALLPPEAGLPITRKRTAADRGSAHPEQRLKPRDRDGERQHEQGRDPPHAEEVAGESADQDVVTSAERAIAVITARRSGAERC